MNRIYCYLRGTKDKVLLINTSKKMVVGCYVDTYFSGLWVHENSQYPVCDRSRTVFVVTFSNCPLLWVSKIHTGINISNQHYIYL